MSTIIYNRNGGIEINPDPFLKIQFRRIGSIGMESIKGYGKIISVPSARCGRSYEGFPIIDLPDFNELSNFVNSKSQEEVEFFQYEITNDTSPYCSESRVNGIYLSFNIRQKDKLINRENDILDFLGISKDTIKEADKLCDFFKSSEIVIERGYDIYFLRRVHTSNNIISGWLFNGRPDNKIFTSVDISSTDWMDNLDETLEGIYFDLTEIIASEDFGKVLIPVILNPKGIGVFSSGLNFCMSRVNGKDKDEIFNYLDSKIEKKLEDRIPINLSELYIKHIMEDSIKNKTFLSSRERDFYRAF